MFVYSQADAVQFGEFFWSILNQGSIWSFYWSWILFRTQIQKNQIRCLYQKWSWGFCRNANCSWMEKEHWLVIPSALQIWKNYEHGWLIWVEIDFTGVMKCSECEPTEFEFKNLKANNVCGFVSKMQSKFCRIFFSLFIIAWKIVFSSFKDFNLRISQKSSQRVLWRAYRVLWSSRSKTTKSRYGLVPTELPNGIIKNTYTLPIPPKVHFAHLSNHFWHAFFVSFFFWNISFLVVVYSGELFILLFWNSYIPKASLYIPYTSLCTWTFQDNLTLQITTSSSI